MANFFILSEGGDGLGLAIRLQEEGHRVSMKINDPDLESRGESLIEKNTLPGFNPIIISDCTGSGPILDALRASGADTFNGSQVADRLECDRAYASQVFKEANILQPDSMSFDSWEEGEAFIHSQDGRDVRLVFKPEGKNSGNIPSYVSKDMEDLLKYIEQAKIKMAGSPEFTLQEFIEGTCISSEVWYAKDHFVYPFNHTLERKQFMCGDIGPSGGCTGNVVWGCFEEDCPLCRNLQRLSGFLEENAYNGCIDINSVVSKDGEVYALEFTPRFGYDAFPTLLYGLFDGNFGDFIESCAKGRGPDEMPIRPGFAAGVRISVPPWPSEDFKSKANLSIGGLHRGNLEKFYFYEVSSYEDSLVTSSGVGIIGVAVGYSKSSIEEAFEDAYKVCEKIQLQDKQYRTDLSDVFKSDVRKLSRALEAKLV